MATCGGCGGKGYTIIINKKTGTHVPLTCLQCGGSGQLPDPPKKK